MNRLQLFLLILTVCLAACSATDQSGTIGQLRNVELKIDEEQIEGGLDKAIAGYQHFLEESAGSAMVPEAIRRLADLKVEKEYGLITDVEKSDQMLAGLTVPESAAEPVHELSTGPLESTSEDMEDDADFEQQATGPLPLGESLTEGDGRDLTLEDLERAGAIEAVELYRKLLKEYPLYERNDQVLYQLSRAHEELGQIEAAMEVMNQLVRDYPDSRYMDEVQFRRAEYFFTHRRFMDAEEAYGSVADIGVGSSYYLLALYKLGWTFYKQELYEDAIDRFVALLDYKVTIGYDFEQSEDDLDGKRVLDTFRVISLSFSYLGGAESVVDYFSRLGRRGFEDSIYGHLAEYYFNKRRYSDAVSTYQAFVSRNPYHMKAPHFQMRVIKINVAGGFPSLVIESKKVFANNYAMDAEYWQHFQPEDRPDVLKDLKTNLTDLANHYHALYQNPKYVDKKPGNFSEALHWYRAFLDSFPQDSESPSVNYQLADLLLENSSFADAAMEYEKTAYDYPNHDQASKAGYAAVYAFRKHLKLVTEKDADPVKREVVRSSLKFAATFPEHEKAAVVLAAAADDLYALADFEEALYAAWDLIENFSGADLQVRRSAWLVAAHSSYELELYNEAETSYLEVLTLLEGDDKARETLVDNLAAAIYRQGEEANQVDNFADAAEHFLRVATIAPTSTIRSTAEYDGAAALIKLKEWGRAASVLTGFRDRFPGHELQHEITKKLAFVFRENSQFSQAADEYERIEKESDNDELRREALLIAAELHEKVQNIDRALFVYRRYVELFPKPVELNLETRNKIAEFYKQLDKRKDYLKELATLVALDADAGDERTDRTRYLAAHAALVLAEVGYERFAAVTLVQPFKTNLRLKQKLMKAATQEFTNLLDYRIGEVTAAATYYLAEIYANFSSSLMDSERPKGLQPIDLEEYELAIEEQAYPFEERAIEVHQSNLALISIGIYNQWIEKSLTKLAEFIPARYAKTEEDNAIIAPLEIFTFEIVGLASATPTGGQVPIAESESDRDSVPLDDETVQVGFTDGTTTLQTETPQPATVDATASGETDPEDALTPEREAIVEPEDKPLAQAVEEQGSAAPSVSENEQVALQGTGDDASTEDEVE